MGRATRYGRQNFLCTKREYDTSSIKKKTSPFLSLFFLCQQSGNKQKKQPLPHINFFSSRWCHNFSLQVVASTIFVLSNWLLFFFTSNSSTSSSEAAFLVA